MANRLAEEESPYLRQHAQNPVDWYPWCDDAFKKALDENRPIFLSIGYSSCHWCHVMEREVFEDEDIAEFLNEHFISIKVDREERPDIDKHYQSVHLLLNQRPGGWPLSIFMTPDKKPFFAGTYIPPVRKFNMMGFKELIEIIHEKWSRTPESINRSADEIERFLTPKDGPTKATKLDLSLCERMVESSKDSFDGTYGGFLKAPKFPHASTMNTLLDIYGLTGDKEALNMVETTLTNMAKGGLYDLVDGGFCRYSTDDIWLVPHFEKMTYDNGLLCETYLKAYMVTKKSFYKKIAFDIIDFMNEKMGYGRLFYSASDADSEGEEGKYFVYEYREVMEALKEDGFDESEAKEVCRALSITPSGNFEGKNIVRNETLREYEWWPRVKEVLKAIRKERTYPFIDEKIITSWNAMMIKSLFIASEIEKERLKYGVESLEALLELMYVDGVLFHSTLAGRRPKIEAFLEDYAYLCDALLQAYQTTLDEKWLSIAYKLAQKAIELFYEDGKWFFSRGEFPTQADISDTGYPASSAVMTNNLLTLGTLFENDYTEKAFKSLELNSIKIVKQPMWHASFVKAALRYLNEDVVVKSLPNRLEKVRSMIQTTAYPYILLKSEIVPEFVVCNRHSCFAACKSEEELEKALAGL